MTSDRRQRRTSKDFSPPNGHGRPTYPLYYTTLIFLFLPPLEGKVRKRDVRSFPRLLLIARKVLWYTTSCLQSPSLSWSPVGVIGDRSTPCEVDLRYTPTTDYDSYRSVTTLLGSPPKSQSESNDRLSESLFEVKGDWSHLRGK